MEWRTQVPWPYFLNGINGYHLRAQIELAIGLDDDGDVIVKRLLTSINDSLLASIFTSSSGQQVSVSSPVLGGLLYSIEQYGAEGPLETEWGDDQRSDGEAAQPSGNMAQQFAEAVDGTPDEVDLDELFLVCSHSFKRRGLSIREMLFLSAWDYVIGTWNGPSMLKNFTP